MQEIHKDRLNVSQIVWLLYGIRRHLSLSIPEGLGGLLVMLHLRVSLRKRLDFFHQLASAGSFLDSV